MSNIFFIGDTHFGHEKILKHESNNRPFFSIYEHDQEIVDRWNSVVSKRDMVYHLGDVMFDHKCTRYVEQLKGRKILVAGNHDLPYLKKLESYFEKIVPILPWKKRIVLSHVPIHEKELSYRWRFNFHGHLHSKIINDRRYFNMSAEMNNLYPIPWELYRGAIENELRRIKEQGQTDLDEARA